MATNATESQSSCASDEHTPNTTSEIFFLAQNLNLNIKKSVDIISGWQQILEGMNTMNVYPRCDRCCNYVMAKRKLILKTLSLIDSL